MVRLLFITGKGGVGKTAITCAMGLLFSRAGLRTLMVELNGISSIPSIFDKRSHTYRISSLGENLFHLSINKYGALEEYLLLRIRSTILYRLLFKNRVMQRVIDVAPGIQELFTLGKLWEIENDTTGHDRSRKLFDIIMVDSPSTGHSLGLFKAPISVMEIVRAGPIYNECRKVIDLISDPLKTGIIVVTIPEEMAINETYYLCGKLRYDFRLPLKCVVLNRFIGSDEPSVDTLRYALFESPLPEETKGSFKGLLDTFEEKIQMQEFYRENLLREIDFPLILASFVPDLTDSKGVIEDLSRTLTLPYGKAQKVDVDLLMSVLRHPLLHRPSLYMEGE